MAKTEVSAAPGGERPLECLLRGSFEPTRWKKSYVRFRNSIRFVLHPPFSSNYLLLDDFIYHLRPLFDKKYGRLKSLYKIVPENFFNFALSNETTTTTIPRKSNSRRVHDLFPAKVPYLLSHSRSKLRRWDRAIARLDAATRRREFTSPLAFSPRIIRDQQYKSGTKSSRFERGESSFPSLRNPYSPRISHLHLSVSNARF